MLEGGLNHIKPKFREDIEELSQKWAELDDEQQKVEITCLFELVRSLGFSKEQFYSEAAECFDKNAQTIIQLWIDSFIIHGPKILKPDFIPPAVQPTHIKESPRKMVPLEDLIDEALRRPLPEKEKSVKKEKPKTTIRQIIKSKKCDHFSRNDANFTYKNIQNEWGDLSQLDRALVLKELFRYESFTLGDKDKAFTKLTKKFGFLSREQIQGYLEISGRPDSLRYYASKNFLDDEAVGVIGNMRLELGDLFDVKELVTELRRATKKHEGLTEDGLFTIEFLKAIRQKFGSSVDAVNDLMVGETYVINPDSPFAKEYEGYIGDTFQFLSQEDKSLSDYKDLIKRSSQALFMGRGKRIFVIDYRAVCRPSEVKKKLDF
jgi:hypothetical protein